MVTSVIGEKSLIGSQGTLSRMNGASQMRVP